MQGGDFGNFLEGSAWEMALRCNAAKRERRGRVIPLGRIGDAAHEEDEAGFVVADEEEEGVVGAEVDGGLLDAGGAGAHDDGGGGGGFGAFFVEVDVGFVDDGGDGDFLFEGGRERDAGEIGGGGEGGLQTEFIQGVGEGKRLRDFEARQGEIDAAVGHGLEGGGERVGGERFFERGKAVGVCGEEDEHGESGGAARLRLVR